MNKAEGYSPTLPDVRNEPYDTIGLILDMVHNLLAAIGLIACAVVVGLYFGGFFHHVAAKFPDGFLAWALGVTS